MNNVEKISTTGIFTNYIYKAIPLAFDESMSYYETLAGLLHYLKNTVIPALNGNADALLELQKLYTELKKYCDDYFENLNVQNEINKKLDSMAQDGTLDKIINNNLFSNLNDKIDNNTKQIQSNNDETNKKITNLQVQIGKIKDGTPKAVTSTSQMEDETQIYVLTTDSKWYYYNGSQWVAGGDYPSTTIDENSIITPDVKRIEQFKIVNNGYYAKKITTYENIFEISEDGSIINFSANPGVVIHGSHLVGFDIYIPITQEMADNKGFSLLNKIDGNNNDLVVLLPQVNYENVPVLTQDNYYFVTCNNKGNIPQYLEQHVGELLQIRICFTNTSGISVTFENMYIIAYRGTNTINAIGNIIGDKPSLQQQTSLNVPYNYNKLGKSYTFNFTSAKGLTFPVTNFDANKDLMVYLNKLSGDVVDGYLTFVRDDGTEFYTATAFNENKIIKWSKEFFETQKSRGINNVRVVLATSQPNITNDNHYTATINFPIISQSPYDVDYLNTLYEIKESIDNINYDLQGSSNRLLNSTMMVLGDSMARGHTLPRDDVWDSLIAKRNDMTLINLAQNGKFYSRYWYNTEQSGKATPYTEEELNTGKVNNIAVVDMVNDLSQSTDYIVVFCGSNDMNSNVPLGNFLDNNYTSFYGCLYKIFNTLITKYPTQKILVITPYPVTTNYERDMKYINAIKQICQYFCIPVYDNYNAGLCMSNAEQKSALMLDSIHLNKAGQLRVSYKYQEQLKLL